MVALTQPSCHNRLKSLNSFSVSLLGNRRDRGGRPEEGAGAADSTGLAQSESAHDRFRIGLDDPKQRRCRTGGPPTALLVLLHRVQREAESPSDIVPESAPTLPGAPEPVPARAAGAQAPRSPTHRRST